MNYQTDYALFQTLRLLGRAYSEPQIEFAVKIEARSISLDGVTAWDIALQPDDLFIEAKHNPTKADVFAWLDNVRETAVRFPLRKYRLVHSKDSLRLLHSLKRLKRLATEADRDDQTFRLLLGQERDQAMSEILTRLGREPLKLLHQLDLQHYPADLLTEIIESEARALAGESGGLDLRRLLFEKIERAVPDRATLSITKLIQEAKSEAIPLQWRSADNPPGVSPEAHAVFVILQECHHGLPIEVLTNAINRSADDLYLHLRPQIESHVIIVEDALWSLAPRSCSFATQGAPDNLAQALRALLNYIQDHRKSATARLQISNAVLLAHKCAVSHPALVAEVFRYLNPLLKRTGDKDLIWEVAKLSVEAARRVSPRTMDVVKSEAVALICGLSWVHQRDGRLDLARALANESLELGESIPWPRNTAFCKKCIGRLYRLEAQENLDRARKDELYALSAASLQEAIEHFDGLNDDDRDAEKGDCYSLLARTYHEAGNKSKADRAARQALPLLNDRGDKDYLDYQIILGDISAERNEWETARAYYNLVIGQHFDDDPEKTDMRARAFYRRGLCWEKERNPNAALRDLQQAATMWHALNDRRSAANAVWAIHRIEKQLPQRLIEELRTEKAVVRVAAIQLYQERVKENAAVVVGRRAEPTTQEIERLKEQARALAIREVPERA
jgi:tetratricopeptide (TPR) repeat protein